MGQCPDPVQPRDIAYFSGEVVSKQMVPADYYGTNMNVLVINGYAPRIVEKQYNGRIILEYHYNDKIPYKSGVLRYKTPESLVENKIHKDLSSPTKVLKKENKNNLQEPKEDIPSITQEEYAKISKELNDLKKDFKRLKEEQELEIPTLQANPKSLNGE